MPQYTIRNIPQPIDRALREVARRRGISLNDATIAMLQRGLGVSGENTEYSDLDELIGTWQEDEAFDQAIAEQDKIDPALVPPLHDLRVSAWAMGGWMWTRRSTPCSIVGLRTSSSRFVRRTVYRCGCSPRWQTGF